MSNLELTPNELELYRILSDPVLFAATHLNWHAREYQADILRSNAPRKLVRAGRRVGKCLSARANVMTEIGPVNVRALLESDERPSIVTFNLLTHKLETTCDYSIWSNGVKPVYRLTTRTGRSTEATDNHPFLVIGQDGLPRWVELKDIKTGDRIAVPASYEGVVAGKPVGRQTARLLGYLCGDGKTTGRGPLEVHIEDPDVFEDFKSVVEYHGCCVAQHDKSNPYRCSIVGPDGAGPHNNPLNDLVRQHGLWGRKAAEKRVPQAILGGTEEDIRHFLAAYWDCDGWIHIAKSGASPRHPLPRFEIAALSASEGLARDIKHLLLRLGINAKLSKRKVRYGGADRSAWTVAIHDVHGARGFLDKIPLTSKRYPIAKLRALLAQKKDYDTNQLRALPKEVWAHIRRRQRELGLSGAEIARRAGMPNMRLRDHGLLMREKAKALAAALKDDYLRSLAEGDVLWDEVVSIDYAGEAETYDLNVPSTHTLVADDVISHNSDMIAVDCIWRSYTRGQLVDSDGGRRPHVSIIVTPFEDQVANLFDRIRELIRNSESVSESIDRDTKNPQLIQFKNGSMIKGFTAGTKSGSEAGKIRGQRADYIYLDEADYLSEADVNTVVAIALERPDIGIWASSTPSGRRQHFYRWHLNASLPDGDPEKRWTEWHFPSYVNPNWGPEMEAEFRDIFTTEVAYIREVLADWGEEAAGVYAPPLVEDARRDYRYLLDPGYHALRTMGVDWDKYRASPEIVILEYKPAEEGSGLFQVIYRETIPRVKYTLDYAVNRVIELDKVFRPAHIYVDRGYGDYQVERLQILGKEASPGDPTYGLDKRVKGVQFKETIAVREPGSGKVINKNVKEAMVAFTSFLLERRALAISAEDKHLPKQMLEYNYQISPAGNIRYVPGPSGDHILDALHLAVLAFACEFPDLFDLQYRAKPVKELYLSRRSLIPERTPVRGWERVESGLLLPGRGDDVSDRKEAQRMMEKGWIPARSINETSKRPFFATWGPRGSRSKPPTRRMF